MVDLWDKAQLCSLSHQFCAFWKVGLIAVFKIIWHLWNLTVFEDMKPSITTALALLWRFIREAEFLVSGFMFNSMTELLILWELRIRDRLCKAPNTIEVIWRPPPFSWVNVNTDGSAFGAPGLSRCSGVFRTHRGFVRGCFFILLRVCYAFEVELAVAIHTINFA